MISHILNGAYHPKMPPLKYSYVRGFLHYTGNNQNTILMKFQEAIIIIISIVRNLA